jgi:hypothetical protein
MMRKQEIVTYSSNKKFEQEITVTGEYKDASNGDNGEVSNGELSNGELSNKNHSKQVFPLTVFASDKNRPLDGGSILWKGKGSRKGSRKGGKGSGGKGRGGDGGKGGGDGYKGWEGLLFAVVGWESCCWMGGLTVRRRNGT